LFVPVIDPAEELGVETKLGEDSDMGRTVSECIDLPPHCRNILWAEGFRNPQVSQSHVVNYIFEVTGCFVVHGDSAPYELQLLVLDQLPDFRFLALRLFCPPNLEEPDFYLNKLPAGVLLQLHHVVGDDFSHVLLDDLVFITVVIFAKGNQPAQVVVAVRNQVH
jgi:hypothetical protein